MTAARTSGARRRDRRRRARRHDRDPRRADYLLTQGDVLEEKDLTLRGAGADVTIDHPDGGGDALDDEGVTVARPQPRRPALELSEERQPPTKTMTPPPTAIETKAQIIALIVTFAIFLFVLDLVRRRRLSERYAIIWMTAAFALLVLSIWTGGLDAHRRPDGHPGAANAIFIIAFARRLPPAPQLLGRLVPPRRGDEGPRPGGRAPRAGAPPERSLRGGEENGFSGRASADGARRPASTRRVARPGARAAGLPR